MPQRLFRASPGENRPHASPFPEDPGDELRSVIRLDWVVYILAAVIAVLALSVLAGVDAGGVVAVMGMLVTLVTGIIGGILAYLRRKDQAGKKPGGDEDANT